jgi:hypothetical protein
MVIPIGRPHPVINSLAVVRPLAILPAAGAWDPVPLEFQVAGFDFATLYFTYTWDALSIGFGAFDFQLQASPYAINRPVVQNWFPQSLYAAGILAAGADTQSRIQREYVTYRATAGGLGVPETFSRGLVRVLGAERVRVIARESGDVGLPGTLEIVAVLSTVD